MAGGWSDRKRFEGSLEARPIRDYDPNKRPLMGEWVRLVPSRSPDPPPVSGSARQTAPPSAVSGSKKFAVPLVVVPIAAVGLVASVLVLKGIGSRKNNGKSPPVVAQGHSKPASMAPPTNPASPTPPVASRPGFLTISTEIKDAGPGQPAASDVTVIVSLPPDKKLKPNSNVVALLDMEPPNLMQPVRGIGTDPSYDPKTQSVTYHFDCYPDQESQVQQVKLYAKWEVVLDDGTKSELRNDPNAITQIRLPSVTNPSPNPSVNGKEKKAEEEIGSQFRKTSPPNPPPHDQSTDEN